MEIKKTRNQIKNDLKFHYPDSRFAMRTDSEYQLIKIEIISGFCTPDILATHIQKSFNLSAENINGTVFVSDKNGKITVDFSVLEKLKPVINSLPGNLTISQFTEIVLAKLADKPELIKHLGFDYEHK